MNNPEITWRYEEPLPTTSMRYYTLLCGSGPKTNTKEVTYGLDYRGGLYTLTMDELGNPAWEKVPDGWGEKALIHFILSQGYADSRDSE